MTATVDYTLAATDEIRRKTNETDSPIMVNPASSVERIGLGLEALEFLNTQTVMKPRLVVGGKLSASGTIDFRAAPDPRIPASLVDCNGYRLNKLGIFPAAGNAAEVVFAPGASNPYSPFGASTSCRLLPGEEYKKAQRLNGAVAPAVRQAQVDATHKTVDVTLTGSDSVEWVAVFGD